MSPVVKKPTKQPEREAAGNAFIRQREKTASQLEAVGQSQAGAVRTASQAISAGAEANDPKQIINRQLEFQALQKQVEQQRQNELLKTSANLPFKTLGKLTPEQEQRQVIQGEGVVGNIEAGVGGIVGAAGGAGTGAVIGGAVGSIVPGAGTAAGALVGGGIGGVIGGLGGVFTKVTTSKRQDVKTATQVFEQSANNMVWIINQANKGAIDPVTASIMWNEELSNFYSAERNLKQDTDSNIDRFLSGGTDEAARMEAFRRRLPQLQLQLETALIQPNINMQNEQTNSMEPSQ